MATVLVVDDLAEQRRIASRLLEREGSIRTLNAANGVEALAAIEQHPPDVVVTDLQMPKMNGLELVKAIRKQHGHIPVILITAYGSEDIAAEALRAGAASYVPKRNLAKDLLPTIYDVLAVSGTKHRRRLLLKYMTRAEFDFVLSADPAAIQPLVNHLQEYLIGARLCDGAGEIRVATALHEALNNALYHGCLEISSACRQSEEADFRYVAEMRRREVPYRDRRIFVVAKYSPSRAVFVIRDEGHGFDPAGLPDPTDPINLAKPCGRGLFLIRAFMDDVAHNDAGNEITMVKRRDTP